MPLWRHLNCWFNSIEAQSTRHPTSYVPSHVEHGGNQYCCVINKAGALQSSKMENDESPIVNINDGNGVDDGKNLLIYAVQPLRPPCNHFSSLWINLIWWKKGHSPNRGSRLNDDTCVCDFFLVWSVLWFSDGLRTFAGVAFCFSFI